MTTDLKDVLMELDSKIAEVYDLDLAEEMSDIYVDLTDRLKEFSSKYWKLVNALAKTEKERDDLLMKYNGLFEEHNKTLEKYEECLRRNNGTLKQYNETSREYYGLLKDAAKTIEKVEKEKDQAEYDRDYYRDEVYRLRTQNEALIESHIKCIDVIKNLL